MKIAVLDQLIDLFGLAFHAAPQGNFAGRRQTALSVCRNAGKVAVDQALRRRGMERIDGVAPRSIADTYAGLSDACIRGGPGRGWR